jgi:uncharacterized membrane protein YgcG
MMRSSYLAALSLALPMLVACGGIELEMTSDLPMGSVSDERIELPVGLAVGVRLESADEKETSSMVPADTNIIDASPTGNLHEFIIWGVSPGSTTINVLVNNESKGEIEALVTKYPSTSNASSSSSGGGGSGGGGGGSGASSGSSSDNSSDN